MTKEDFYKLKENLVIRMNNAINLHCFRTAKARMRDIANLTEKYNGTLYDETYSYLLDKYKLRK